MIGRVQTCEVQDLRLHLRVEVTIDQLGLESAPNQFLFVMLFLLLLYLQIGLLSFADQSISQVTFTSLGCLTVLLHCNTDRFGVKLRLKGTM